MRSRCANTYTADAGYATRLTASPHTVGTPGNTGETMWPSSLTEVDQYRTQSIAIGVGDIGNNRR